MKTCVLLSLLATALFAQSESGRASCEGTIVDPTGKAVEGAKLLLKSSQTGATRRATSQGDGKFRLSALPREESRIDGGPNRDAPNGSADRIHIHGDHDRCRR